jgi:hypothetical protein
MEHTDIKIITRTLEQLASEEEAARALLQRCLEELEDDSSVFADLNDYLTDKATSNEEALGLLADEESAADKARGTLDEEYKLHDLLMLAYTTMEGPQKLELLRLLSSQSWKHKIRFSATAERLWIEKIC